MKSLSLYIAAIMALTAGYGWGQETNTDTQWPAEPWLSPTPVELGRELPRTQTICYNSEADAIARSHEASAYLQPLAENWKTAAEGSATVYSHSFKVPFAWIDREFYLYIGAANAPYEIFVNGQRIGYNQTYSTPAEFNISKASQEGVNTVEIKLQPRAASDILDDRSENFKPQLTGETYILAQPRVRVRDYVTRTTIEGNDAVIELGVLLKSNMLNPKTLTVHYAFISPAGEVITSGRRDREIDMRREDTVRFIVNVPNAKLWSPEQPDLYTLLVKTQHEGRYWEYITYKVGIRTVEVSKGELLINGQTFPFRFADNLTLNNHKPDSKEGTAAWISEMKSRGINTIQAYRPLPDWFYSLCDEKGLFIVPQTGINTSSSGDSRQVGGNPANDPAWEASYKDRMESMMYTSWHHPSVIGFSLSAGVSNGYNLYESYLAAKEITAEAGDRRPVIYTTAAGEWNTDAVVPQVVSSNAKAVDGRIILEESQTSAETVTFAAKDPSKGVFTATSNMSFRTTDAIVSYTVVQGAKRKVARGTVEVRLVPGVSTEINIPYGKANPGKGALTVKLSTNIPAYGPNPAIVASKDIGVNF